MIPGLRAVLFDRDETIVYTDPETQRQAVILVAQQHQLEPQAVGAGMAALWKRKMSAWQTLRTLQQEEQFWEQYGLELARQLGIDEQHAAQLMTDFPYEHFMRPFPHAQEVLAKLRQQGLKVGVLSNTLPSISRTLQAVGLAEVVDVALSSCALGVHKPGAQAFLLAAQALALRPQEILFVDDLAENVEAARQVGMHAALIDHTGQRPGALHDLRAVLKLVQL